MKAFSDAWQFMMNNDVPGCRSLDQPYDGADQDSFQYYVIDGFIVSDNVTVKECETVDMKFANTDHNPVIRKVVLE